VSCRWAVVMQQRTPRSLQISTESELRTQEHSQTVVADIRLTALTSVADTFSGRAVSRTPRP
jgi:hypothetical protein